MRVVPDRMTDIWQSGVFTGSARPIARVTLQPADIVTVTAGKQRFASYYFGDTRAVFELPNVYKVSWTRSVDQDTGTCEINLYNTKALPIGVKPSPNEMVYNQPGFFTFNRGEEENEWDHTINQWRRRLFPDDIVKTYEGYGFDPDLPPDEDPNLVQTGVWIIDQVTLTAQAAITLKCRDAGRLLTDHLAFPPVVPVNKYPLSFQHRHEVANPKKPVVVAGEGFHWVNPAFYDDSGTPYNGRNGSIGGHRASDAFDGSDASYWLSIGNSNPRAGYSFEWIEGKLPNTTTVAAVRVYTKGGPYRMYVSLHKATGGWVGSATIPYDPDNPASAPNGANIPYVKSATVNADSDVFVDLTDTPGIDRVRVTFTSLWDSNYGTYQYRAAVRDFDVLMKDGAGSTTWVSNGTHTEGNYSDYSDIVKLLLAYGGFLWPASWTEKDYYHLVGDPPSSYNRYDRFREMESRKETHHPINDPVLTDSGKPAGAVWGDIENSGTYGPSDLGTEIFDKKTLMDGIAYIRDILGFIFYVDAWGGAQFRSPNIWAVGNWLRELDHRIGSAASRTDDIVTLDRFVGLSVTLDSKNVRERVVIANQSGNHGAVTRGFSPYGRPTRGYRRVSIWSDQHFESDKECQVMADLIAVRQLFTFRTDTIQIAGYPAIEIDDQVKLVEPVTEENHDIHYVKTINSNLDMSTGTYTYDLGTHWLGSEPFGKWAFDPANLDPFTQYYLNALGKITI